jgi:hypothetical protein
MLMLDDYGDDARKIEVKKREEIPGLLQAEADGSVDPCPCCYFPPPSTFNPSFFLPTGTKTPVVVFKTPPSNKNTPKKGTLKPFLHPP